LNADCFSFHSRSIDFELMRKQVEAWQRSELADVTANVVIYEAFIEGRLEAPKHLARGVHDLYFEPKYEEFRPRTIWSLSNAFTSAFKELDPIPHIFRSATPCVSMRARQTGSACFLFFFLCSARLRAAPG
jgi:hypothetical protein